MEYTFGDVTEEHLSSDCWVPVQGCCGLPNRGKQLVVNMSEVLQVGDDKVPGFRVCSYCTCHVNRRRYRLGV